MKGLRFMFPPTLVSYSIFYFLGWVKWKKGVRTNKKYDDEFHGLNNLCNFSSFRFPQLGFGSSPEAVTQGSSSGESDDVQESANACH